MNKNRKARLMDVLDIVRTAQDRLSDIAEEEQDSLDNIPESLQSSERYEQMEIIVETLTEAACNLNELVYNIESVI